MPLKDATQELVKAIALVGRNRPSSPILRNIEPFRHFFLPGGKLDYKRLDERDGACTCRELLLRFLVLNAVIDQGPDIVGVRKLLTDVTNELYLNEIRFLHRPSSFFEELGIAIDHMLDKHQSIKKLRAATWAAENRSNPRRYNLFMDNSKQVLHYAVSRWGVSLALPLLLERDSDLEERRPTILVDYLESWKSAEEMSQQLKDNERYGLGKTIGDKACHLFAKWMVSSFRLSRRSEPEWGDFSFEVPYDSNAGRVLWRTGFLLKWASEQDYIRQAVVQRGAGKGGANYIRVTNIRGMGTSRSLPTGLEAVYADIVVNHLKTNQRAPRKVQIQRIQHAYLKSSSSTANLTAANFDDGLVHIGTNYCFNHSEPICKKCPIKRLCEGYQSNRRLIENYRT